MSKRLKLYNNEYEYLIAQSQQSFNQYVPNAIYCVGENKSFYNDISSNNTIYDDRQYIKFEDTEIERVCALNFGDSLQTITTDNNDNTITITKKYISRTNTTITQNQIISQETRQKTEQDTTGTITTPIGITYQQAHSATAIKNFADIIGNLIYMPIIANFSTSIHIYGLKAKYKTRTADSPFINFLTDTNHILSLNVYHMYYGYDTSDGSSGYIYLTTFPYNLGDDNYLTFFNDSYSSSRVNTYVTFTSINGYHANLYVPGYVFALVNKNDI